MAIYHCSIKVFGRSKGACSVAKAAYRSGSVLRDERTGETHDYTRKSGVVHCEILLPKNAPSEYADRSTLWNSVEQFEKAGNAQVAREVEVALPAEISREQQILLARRYVSETFVSAGMCADVCVHDTGKGNPHAHIMLTMRPLNEDGSWGDKQHKVYTLDENGDKIYDPVKRQYKCSTVKTVDWNDRSKAEDWRRAWAAYANGALRIAGLLTEENELDHRSYQRQGKDELPTVHLGVAASQMKRNGIPTDKGDYNREIEKFNRQLKQIKARIIKVQDWLKETKATTPTLLFDTLQAMLTRDATDSNYAKIRNIQQASRVLNFITEHKISDFAELTGALGDLFAKRQSISDKLKPVDRRIKTLKEHLMHSENFNNYRKVAAKRDALYAKYNELSKQGFFAKGKANEALKKAEAYDWQYLNELQDFDKAETYLRGVLQSRFDPKKLPPITSWTSELTDLLTEKKHTQIEYNGLNAEVKSVETIRRYAEQIMRGDEGRGRTRKYEIGL